MKNKFETGLIILNLAILIALLFDIDIIKSFILLVIGADIFLVAYQYNKNKK